MREVGTVSICISESPACETLLFPFTLSAVSLGLMSRLATHEAGFGTAAFGTHGREHLE